MLAIYPVTSLQKNSAEVKAAAREQVVHITENGRSTYVFATEEAFEEYVARERAEAAREALLFEAVDRGVADVEEGRTSSFDFTDELLDHLEARRIARRSGGVA